jgi:hypothetical protein
MDDEKTTRGFVFIVCGGRRQLWGTEFRPAVEPNC